MLKASSQCSVMEEISKTEEAIKDCYHRLHSMELKIDSDEIPEARKTEIKKELSEVRKLLRTNEDQLSTLHKHNRTSFVFAAGLLFIFFTIYAFYILIYGRDF